MLRNTKFPPAIEAQYRRIYQLLKPTTRSKIKRSAVMVSKNFVQFSASRFHKLAVTQTKKAFPKSTPAQLEAASFFMVCEAWMEAVRNKRQEYQTWFENFDQKSNQLFQILSTVIKSLKEMQDGIVRNLL